MVIGQCGRAAAPGTVALSTSQVGCSRRPCSGFVGGTALSAVMNLATSPSRVMFAVAALLAPVVRALLLVDGFAAAIVTRFACGFCLAGVYPRQ